MRTRIDWDAAEIFIWENDRWNPVIETISCTTMKGGSYERIEAPGNPLYGIVQKTGLFEMEKYKKLDTRTQAKFGGFKSIYRIGYDGNTGRKDGGTDDEEGEEGCPET